MMLVCYTANAHNYSRSSENSIDFDVFSCLQEKYPASPGIFSFNSMHAFYVLKTRFFFSDIFGNVIIATNFQNFVKL